MDNIAYLTIEERIELYKKNMAYSPSDAARKVTSLAETEMSELIDDDVFVENDNSKRNIGSVMYREFCSKLSSVISKELRKKDKSPYESRFGNTYSDYIYITALNLASLPARLEKYYDYMPQIYYDMRMTLGNYLDALIDISCDSAKGKPNTRRANQYRRLKKELSGIIDLSKPLCEAIGILLNEYSDSHAELDRLSHIQECKANLDRKLQMDEMREEFLDYEEDPLPNDLADSWADDEGDSWSDDEDESPDEDGESEEQDYIIEIGNDNEDISPIGFVTDDDFGDEFDVDDEEFDDEFDDYDDFDDDDLDDDPDAMEQQVEKSIEFNPSAYFLSEARKLPDISVKSPERLYGMGYENPNLLADKDYSPEGFKARIDAAELTPEFRKVADEVITAEGIASAFKGMDAATDKLYRLLIEPFVDIEKYRFDCHLASEV